VVNLDSQFPVKEFRTDVVVKDVPWYVRDLWQRGKINVTFGPEKSGKTRFINWMIVNSLLHDNAMDLAVEWRPNRILYLAAEETIEDVNSRMLRYVGYAGAVPRQTLLPISFISASGMRLDHGQQRAWLQAKFLDEGFDMMVIDPLRRVHGADENDNTAMALIFNDLRRWTNQHDLTLLMLHHTGKLHDEADYNRIATWSRGATDLAAILDTAQFVDRASTKELRVVRAGRFRPVKPLQLVDGLDADFVFRRKLGT
jgi:RecA-family ATPase